MRVSPTPEQMDYLASIGVSKATTPRPAPMSAASTEDVDLSSASSESPAVQWWVILLIILVLTLSLARLSRSEETRQPTNSIAGGAQVASQGDNTPMVERLDAIEMELSKLRDARGHDETLEQLAAFRWQITTIEQRLTTIQETMHTDLDKDRQLVANKLQLLEVSLNELKSSIGNLSTTYSQWRTGVEGRITAGTEETHAQVADAKRISSRLIDTEVEALREDLAAQREDFHWALLWFSVVTVLGIGLLMIGRILMERRIRQVEQTAISRPNETDAITSDTPIPLPVSGMGIDLVGSPDTQKTIKIQPGRPQPQPLPETVKQMQEDIVSADRFRGIRVKPTLPCGPWEIGLATNKGNVRSENQDFGVCFKIDGHDVLIVADGCGGLPHGQRAALLAVDSAAESVVGAYGMAPSWHRPHVMDVAARSIRHASHRLAAEGEKLNITDVTGGLRTTLIVVVGSQRETGYAYIGDGGGCVVKSTGEVDRFLDPQKASVFEMNVLAASLGSKMEGEPVIGVMKRDPGDLLMVGTDGVFDRVESTFPKDVLRGCIQYKGDLQKTAEHIVDELASFEDAAGYICDDNLTLGIMGDGTNPKLSRGFWSSIGETKAAQSDPPLSGVAENLKEDVS